MGANWGMREKGAWWITRARCHFVVRYQGGNNAGHTVVNDYGEFKLHLLPSGVFYPTVTNILGPGMVIDIEELVKEIEELQGKGITPNIRISERATICFPFHRLEDGLEEDRLKECFGSATR